MELLEEARSARISPIPAADPLAVIRADFERRSKRSISMPLAGTLIWSAIALAGLVLPAKTAIIVLISATGAIFPVALVIARLRGEELLSNRNELAKLMGACVFMVNLLWAVHIPLLFKAPNFVPLSLSIALGMHWAVYSWVIRHPLGYLHAALRTTGVLAAWVLFPAHPVTACASVVVATYCVALWQMATRHIACTPGSAVMTPAR